MKGVIIAVLGTAALAAAGAAVADDASAPAAVPEVHFRLGGSIRLDMLYSMFLSGAVDPRSPARDYYDPSGIPIEVGEHHEVGHGGENERDYVDFNAKTTRFYFAADGRTAGGEQVSGLLEADFEASPGAGTEVATNAYTPAVRRAFITYGGLRLGQDWSTFQNVDAFPDTLDYIRAPAGGTVYVRQPLVRYTVTGLLGGDWAVALENAETLLQPHEGTLAGTEPVTASFVTGDSRLPDVVLRYDFDRPWAQLSLAALARQLRADDARTGGDAPNDTVSGTATGWGASVAGVIPVPIQALRGDDVRFMVTYGEGIGRYVGLGIVPDGVVDANNGIETSTVLGTWAFYRRAWSPGWRSNFGVSNFSAHNNTFLTGNEVTTRIISLHMNFLYSPVENVTTGVELLDTHRFVADGAHGELHRVMWSMRYAF